jgi:hypothetical protein
MDATRTDGSRDSAGHLLRRLTARPGRVAARPAHDAAMCDPGIVAEHAFQRGPLEGWLARNGRSFGWSASKAATS